MIDSFEFSVFRTNPTSLSSAPNRAQTLPKTASFSVAGGYNLHTTVQTVICQLRKNSLSINALFYKTYEKVKIYHRIFNIHRQLVSDIGWHVMTQMPQR